MAYRFDKKYLFVSRDLNRDLRDENPKAYMDWTSEETTIVSNMHRGYVVPDGWNEIQFIRGASIKINLKAPPLNLITFRNSMISKLNHLIYLILKLVKKFILVFFQHCPLDLELDHHQVS